MKKFAAFFLALLLLSGILAFSAQAQESASVAVAAPATEIIPTVDGVKDAVYEGSTPLTIGAEGDELSGKAYFAYDKEYLYVFFEVHDATLPKTASGNITPACKTDAAFFGVELMGLNEASSSCWNVDAVDDNNYSTGVYGVMRTASNSNQVYEGGHAHLNRGAKMAAVSNEDGYTGEIRVPFGVDREGNAYDTAKLFESGVSVIFAITDAPADSTTADENLEITNYVSNGYSVFRMKDHQSFSAESGENIWQKLEFTPGEFKENRAELTTAPVTVAITTPKIVVTTPKIVVTTPKIVVTTPKIEVTTPKIVVTPAVETTSLPSTPPSSAEETQSAAPVASETQATEAPVTSSDLARETAPASVTAAAETAEPSAFPVVPVVIIAVVVILAAVVLILIRKKPKN